MLTAELFTIARKSKQPTCPSLKSKENVLHILNEILLSHKKDAFATMWMESKFFILSKITQTQEDKLTCGVLNKNVIL